MSTFPSCNNVAVWYHLDIVMLPVVGANLLVLGSNSIRGFAGDKQPPVLQQGSRVARTVLWLMPPIAVNFAVTGSYSSALARYTSVPEDVGIEI